ncbi:ferritin-like domain-containing protein [Vallitalea okinawensis]|uniref:ferritin-like domain-containing protein n=1 Tax=Vallitalea okinawensis TaxID=2078660 RepID=UPI000CFC1C6B|nr:ferritin-like domain-containing protein [Vallitalea okinawensis]
MTSKELSYCNDTLNAEKNIIKKYQEYSQEVTDPQLKNLCTKLATDHQKHYDQIYNTLNS